MSARRALFRHSLSQSLNFLFASLLPSTLCSLSFYLVACRAPRGLRCRTCKLAFVRPCPSGACLALSHLVSVLLFASRLVFLDQLGVSHEQVTEDRCHRRSQRNRIDGDV